jgi:hypothetical protein
MYCKFGGYYGETYYYRSNETKNQLYTIDADEALYGA